MSVNYLVPALSTALLALLAGCASTDADDVSPNWAAVASPAGVIMTDGHQELAAAPAAVQAGGASAP